MSFLLPLHPPGVRQPLPAAGLALALAPSPSWWPLRQPAGRSPALLLETRPPSPPGVILIRAPAVHGLRVDGRAALPVECLGEGTVLALPGARWQVTLAVASPTAPFAPEPDDAEPPRCARCRDGLEVGEPVQRCPYCGAPHHAREGLRCGPAYAPFCARCRRPWRLPEGSHV